MRADLTVTMVMGLLGVLSGAVASGQTVGSSGGDRGYESPSGAAPQDAASAEAFKGVDRGTAEAAAGKRGQASATSAGIEPTATTDGKGETFPSPEAAVKALIDALRANDRARVEAILGAQEGLLSSGDEIADQAAKDRFLRYYDQKHSIKGGDSGTATLMVGESEWPFPIPIVKRDGGYALDGAAGAKQIVQRRIGRNELGAMGVCNGYVAAQKDYALVGHDGEPAGLYARTLISDEGKQNGLFWPVKADELRSPAGPLLADAADEGYKRSTTGKPTPYHGYLYRTLNGQGSHARGGAKSYLKDGKQVGGFALVAYPAEYGKSGVKTFIVNQDGVVYEKDLGVQTARIASEMREFDPEGSWSPAS